MHPSLSYDLNQARNAEMRHQAQRDALALAARRARRARQHQPGHHISQTPVLAARRLLTALGTRAP